MTVVGQNLLIFLVVFRINSCDLLTSAHVDAVSVSCNRREKRCFIFYWMLLLCLMLWAAENQKKTTNTAGGEVCLNGGEKVRWVQVLLQNSWKTWIRLVFLLLFCFLTYLYKHNFCLPMLVITLVFKLPTRLSFVIRFVRTSWIFQGPQKTPFISHL